jgi:hypothetical protein
VSGDKIHELLARVYALPKAVIERVNSLTARE